MSHRHFNEANRNKLNLDPGISDDARISYPQGLK